MSSDFVFYPLYIILDFVKGMSDLLKDNGIIDIAKGLKTLIGLWK